MTITKSYGFVSNPHFTPNQNAFNLLTAMPSWHYFTRPSNIEMHDLTLPHTQLPKSLTTIIGLGLKFIPTPRRPNRNPTSSFERFTKDFHTKVYFAGRPLISEEIFNPKLHVESTWEPKPWDIPDDIHLRTKSFHRQIRRLLKVRRPKTTNLLPFQTRALSTLARRTDILVVNCDKNLGPAVINTSTYVNRAFTDHLNNDKVYKELDEDEATRHMKSVAIKLRFLIAKYAKSTKHKQGIGKQGLKYLKSNYNPDEAKFPVFYLTLKVHKDPWSTRPIVSCSGSLLYHLGVWVDTHLQTIATAQPTYIKNSKALKDMLMPLSPLPPGARIFTADAKSMYTNIDTEKALIEIAQHIHQRSNRFQDIPADALIESLALIMRNNVFQFGDTFWHQLTGTAMGTPPAPTYANIFFAIHERRVLPKYSKNLLLHKRYIDDIFGIWIPSDDTNADDTQWEKFKDEIDDYHGLRWLFSNKCNRVDFLDITISIDDNVLTTTLFEKSLNLYLYIPPHSAHPPGVLTGLVIGNCHRILTLCSVDADITFHLRRFFLRLRARGYSSATLLPLFHRAHLLAQQSTATKLNADDMLKKRIFFHLEYHPDAPKSPELQEIWQRTIMHPTSEPHLSQVTNMHDMEIEISQMTVAYNRPPNLGNLLSSRNLHNSTGPPVSSYRK